MSHCLQQNINSPFPSQFLKTQNIQNIHIFIFFGCKSKSRNNPLLSWRQTPTIKFSFLLINGTARSRKILESGFACHENNSPSGLQNSENSLRLCARNPKASLFAPSVAACFSFFAKDVYWWFTFLRLKS